MSTTVLYSAGNYLSRWSASRYLLQLQHHQLLLLPGQLIQRDQIRGQLHSTHVENKCRKHVLPIHVSICTSKICHNTHVPVAYLTHVQYIFVLHGTFVTKQFFFSGPDKSWTCWPINLARITFSIKNTLNIHIAKHIYKELSKKCVLLTLKCKTKMNVPHLCHICRYWYQCGKPIMVACW